MNQLIEVERVFKPGYTNEHGVYYPAQLFYLSRSLESKQTYLTETRPVDKTAQCLNPNFNNFLTGTFVPCRKCKECMRRRRWKWYFKAITEIDTWPRTWFITLTFSTIPEDPYKEIQKWLKRVRKKHKKPIKYLCTTEYGSENGRLHYHLLVHCEESLKRRDVESPWSQGFSKAKLASKQNVRDAVTKRRPHNKAVSYVTKYLLKQTQKLRASQHYGKGYNNIPF